MEIEDQQAVDAVEVDAVVIEEIWRRRFHSRCRSSEVSLLLKTSALPM